MVFEVTSALGSLVTSLWDSIVNVTPGIVAAIVILIIGYIVGILLGFIVRKALEKSRIFLKLPKTKFSKLAGKFDFPAFFGILTKWYVIILFLSPAAGFVKMKGLSDFLVSLSMWIPNLIVAVIIGLVGFIAAEYIVVKIHETKAKSAPALSMVAKIIVLIFTAIIALEQLGLDLSVAETSFLIILSGIMLALAIGFGLALKDEAKDLIKKAKKNL